MSLKLDMKLAQSGTKFRIFAQPRFSPSFTDPETIYISVPPQAMSAGPADDRMFVVDAIGKKPYDRYSRPQWNGKRRDPVRPGHDGHFDHLDINSRDFSCATMYATVRRVLDIMEDYLGRRIDWISHGTFERLELIPLIDWDNAQSGFGFLEFGYGRLPHGPIDHSSPYCENFDVLAHETGHNLLFSVVGFPRDQSNLTDEFGGFHESGGDLTAIISCLHFDSVIRHMLEQSKGNLFTVNELSRLGELASGSEIRRAFNYERMSTVSHEPHDLSLPLTGAIFDIFVDVFQNELVSRQLITADLAKRSAHGAAPNDELPAIQKEFEKAYAGKSAQFASALISARDYLGTLITKMWDRIEPDNLTYYDVALALLNADQEISGGKNQKVIRECVEWREITVADPHMFSRKLWSNAGAAVGHVVAADHGISQLEMLSRLDLADAPVPRIRSSRSAHSPNR